MYSFETTYHDDDFVSGFHRVEMPDCSEVRKRSLVPEFDGPVPAARHVRTDAWALDVDDLHHAKQYQEHKHSAGPPG